MKMKKMKLSTKLYVSFGMVLLILAGVAVNSFHVGGWFGLGRKSSCRGRRSQ